MQDNHQSEEERKTKIDARLRREARENRLAAAAAYVMLILLGAAIIYAKVKEWRGEH